jgi:acyl-CoA reductase-like NAD-dependent aldehyde dehydrogenase
MTDVLASHGSLQIVSPVHGAVVGTLPMATPQDAAGSVLRARRLAREWARTPASARAGRLHAAAAELRDRADELAASNEAETGRPRAEAHEGVLAYYPATVLTGCTSGMRVMAEETFGPVAPVTVVEDFGEGLTHAMSGDYGLAATVLTGSMRHAQQAWRELPVGTVKINAVFGGAPGGAAQPRGASGTGFGYGPELLDEFTTTKVVHIGLPESRVM